jgi:N-ethylmaleimide reductase
MVCQISLPAPFHRHSPLFTAVEHHLSSHYCALKTSQKTTVHTCEMSLNLKETRMQLLSPFTLGDLKLTNRLVMAPMTRNRALGNIPNRLMAEYYGQRATAGLIITEGTAPSPNGLGYARIPGIFSPEQREGWRLVTEAVHARGGHIFVQLMHCGRVGSHLNLPGGAEVLAPSAVAMSGQVWTDSQGEQPYDKPRQMTRDDIAVAIAEFNTAARLAIEAGFDGIEIHGANGYLINQFLDPGSNQRDDDFGGAGQSRNSFALEVAKAITEAAGAARTGIRLSPYGVFNDMSGAYDNIAEQYIQLATELGRLGLAYLHLVDHSSMGAPRPEPATVAAMVEAFRTHGGGATILSGGYDPVRAETDLQSGATDLVAFGRPFIANPDLVDRFRNGAALAVPDFATFYTPGPNGYTDYPAGQ